jgi:hypothetical protein
MKYMRCLIRVRNIATSETSLQTVYMSTVFLSKRNFVILVIAILKQCKIFLLGNIDIYYIAEKLVNV